MPNFTGSIALSTGGMGKSIVAQFYNSTGAGLDVSSIGTPPPVLLSSYGNGWGSIPTTVQPEITAPNTLQVLNAYTTNANTSVADGILSASVTIDDANSYFQLYFRFLTDQSQVGIIKFTYATPGSNVLTITYIENSNFNSYTTGTATGPAVAPGTAFTAAVTFNGTATTVTVDGTAAGSFTAAHVTDAVTGQCGVGSGETNPGLVQCGTFSLTTVGGAAVFSDNFAYSVTVDPVTISVNGGAAITLTNPAWAAPGPSAPYVFWPLPQYDTHTLWYNAGYFHSPGTNAAGYANATGGYYGTYGVAAPPNAGQVAAYQAQSTCRFPFQGLLPAAWTVNATWPASASNSAAVTYTVLSGSNGANATHGGSLSASFTASAVTGAGVCGLLNAGSGTSTRNVSTFAAGPFTDKFPTPEALSTYANGWTVESTAGGAPTVTAPNVLSMGTTSGASLATNAGASFADGTVSAVLALGASCGVGLVVRYASSTSYAYVVFEKTTGNASSLSYWEVVSGTAAQVGATVAGPSVFQGQPVTVSVTTSGTAVSVSLSYQNYALDGDGSTLATFTANQTVAPSGGPTLNGVVFQALGSVTVSDAVNGLTVVVSNSGTTGDVVFDAVALTPTTAVSTVIKNTDTVTLSCPTVGWASFADGSYAPVMSNAAVANKVGGYNFPTVDPAKPQTMAIGINVDGDYDYTAIPFQSNFAKRSNPAAGLTGVKAFDPVTLYPTVLTGAGVAYPTGVTLVTTAGTGNLAAGTYEYQVASNNGNGTSPACPPVSAALSATGQITVNWGAAAGASSYNVYGRSAGSIALLASGLTATSYTDTGAVAPSGSLPTPPSVMFTPIIQQSQPQANGKNIAIAPLGNYTLQWNGACNAWMTAGDGSLTEVTADAVITGTTNNTRVYTVADVGQASPGFNVNVSGSAGRADGDWDCDFADFRIWPPGVSTTNPPYVSPWFTATAYGSCVRVMQPIGTNSSNIVNFADMVPESCMTAYAEYTTAPVPVASVGPGDATRHFFPSGNYPCVVTTSAPHGLASGQVVNLNGPVGTLTYANGSSVDMSNYFGIVDVVDATHFQMLNFSYNGSAITNTLTPTGCDTTFNLFTPGMTLKGAVEAANAAGQDLWYNIHLLSSDACVTSTAQYIAANLAAGKKWYLEYSNETWNGGFFQPNTCIYLGNQIQGTNGQDYTYYYVKRMGEVQSLALTSWTAAGRSAASLQKVLGSQYSNPGNTQALATQMKALGVSVDCVAIAPYVTNQVSQSPTLQSVYDAMSVDQLSELLDVNLTWQPRTTQQHLGYLSAAGFPAVKAVAYEGSIQEYVPNNAYGNTQTANAYTRDYAVMHHPRTFQQTLYNLSLDQASGITLYMMFINGGPSYPGGMWPGLQGYVASPGTGSMTADAANLTDPLNFTAAKNEVWGAYKHWSTVAPDTAGVVPAGLIGFFEFLFFHDRCGRGGGGGGFLSLGI